jgi:type II secretory pathway pseudopilin PulG
MSTTSTSMTRARGFSLLETMVAGAILVLVAAGVLSVTSYSITASARTRVRGIAAADAQAQLDRMVIMSGVLGNAGGTDAQRCALFESANGPMDATTGGTAAGTCPGATGSVRTVSNIPIPKSTLKRKVSIEGRDIGAVPGLVMTVEVSGADLSTPISVTTQVKK